MIKCGHQSIKWIDFDGGHFMSCIDCGVTTVPNEDFLMKITPGDIEKVIPDFLNLSSEMGRIFLADRINEILEEKFHATKSKL